MKRRTFAFSPDQAMQLLVDPMCNFFAGLVFLSVLVAVLAKNQPASPWREEAIGRTFANEELLTARLAEVREETAELQKQNRLLNEKFESGPPLPSLTAVEKALAEAIGDEGTEGGLSASENRARLEGSLTRERDRLRAREEALRNEMAALRDESARLQGRLKHLPKAGGAPAALPEIRVRLPLARVAGQGPLYVMIRGGKCFPLQDKFGREDDTHVVRERTVEADIVQPREGKGLDAQEAMEKVFAQIDPQRHYPVLVVYADSFDQYRILRQSLEAKQQAYGWEPRPIGAPFRLSAQGFKPEVQ